LPHAAGSGVAEAHQVVAAVLVWGLEEELLEEEEEEEEEVPAPPSPSGR
jgi:hypothetical protein